MMPTESMGANAHMKGKKIFIDSFFGTIRITVLIVSYVILLFISPEVSVK